MLKNITVLLYTNFYNIFLNVLRPTFFNIFYLGKAKQCELITQITFYNNNFGEFSQIYRTIHFYMIKLLI